MRRSRRWLPASSSTGSPQPSASACRDHQPPHQVDSTRARTARSARGPRLRAGPRASGRQPGRPALPRRRPGSPRSSSIRARPSWASSSALRECQRDRPRRCPGRRSRCRRSPAAVRAARQPVAAPAAATAALSRSRRRTAGLQRRPGMATRRVRSSRSARMISSRNSEVSTRVCPRVTLRISASSGSRSSARCATRSACCAVRPDGGHVRLQADRHGLDARRRDLSGGALAAHRQRECPVQVRAEAGDVGELQVDDGTDAERPGLQDQLAHRLQMVRRSVGQHVEGAELMPRPNAPDAHLLAVGDLQRPLECMARGGHTADCVRGAR